MQLTKGAIGNLINRYKAVLKKCHLMNVFGSLAVAGMLVMGGADVAGAASKWEDVPASPSETIDQPNKQHNYRDVAEGQTIVINGANTTKGAETSMAITGKADKPGVNNGKIWVVNTGGTNKSGYAEGMGGAHNTSYSIVNNGSIFVDGSDAWKTKGMGINPNGTAENKGLIVVKNGGGIVDNSGSTSKSMINSGTIAVEAEGGVGIFYRKEAITTGEVSNSGTITVSNGGIGVHIINDVNKADYNGKVFTNSGTIVADADSVAIHTHFTDNATVRLEGKSHVEGLIKLKGTNNKLVIDGVGADGQETLFVQGSLSGSISNGSNVAFTADSELNIDGTYSIDKTSTATLNNVTLVSGSSTADKALVVVDANSTKLNGGLNTGTDAANTIAGLTSDKGNVSISKVAFKNNTLTADRNYPVIGAVAATLGADQSLTIADSVFENNAVKLTGRGSSGSSGGAALSVRGNGAGARLTVTDSTFSGNSYQDTEGAYNGAYGGAIGVQNASVTLNKVALSQNSADSGNQVQGGAYYQSKGTLNATALTVTNNEVTASSPLMGAGMALFGTDGSIAAGSEISNNSGKVTGSAYGGGLYMRGSRWGGESDLQFNISDTTFSGNRLEATAGAYGGGLYVKGELANSNGADKNGKINVTLKDVTFSGNTVEGATASQGGALYILSEDGLDNAVVTVTNGIFTDNKAAGKRGQGGAIYNAGTLSLQGNTTFSGNSAAQGGAIYNNKGNVTVGNSTVFKHNHSTGQNYGGGAIYTLGGTLTIGDNVQFADNSLDQPIADSTDREFRSAGGAIAAWGAAKLTIGKNAQFTSNGHNATTGNPAWAGGGAIYLDTDGKNLAEMSVDSGALFQGNVAGSLGGAIYMADAKADITAATFDGNKAGSWGGAMFIGQYYNLAGNLVSIKNSTFSKNEAGSYGGAIAIHNNANVEIADGTFSGNTVSGEHGLGGAIYNEGLLTFTGKNLFTDNKAAGTANDIYNAGTITVKDGTTTLNSGLVLAADSDSTVDGGALVVNGSTTWEAESANMTLSKGTLTLQKNDVLNGYGSLADQITNKDSQLTLTSGTLFLITDKDYTLADLKAAQKALGIDGTDPNIRFGFQGGKLVGDLSSDILTVDAESDGKVTSGSLVQVGEDPSTITGVNTELVENDLTIKAGANDTVTITDNADVKVNSVDIKTTADAASVAIEGGTGTGSLTVVGNGADDKLVTSNGDALADITVKDGGTFTMGIDGNSQAQGGQVGTVTVEGGTFNITGTAGQQSDYTVNELVLNDGLMNVSNTSNAHSNSSSFNGGMLFLDPSYMETATAVPVQSVLAIGKGSTLNLGFMDKETLRQAMLDAGLAPNADLTVADTQTVLALGQSIALQGNGQIVLDDKVKAVETAPGSGIYKAQIDGSTVTNTAYFGDDSLLVVDAGKLNGAAITATSGSTAVIKDGAKLKIVNATTKGNVTVLEGFDGNLDINTGWGNTTSLVNADRMLSSKLNVDKPAGTVTITSGVNRASDVLPGLDSDLNPLMAYVWDNGLNDVNSDALGVRFLSRAANSDYIADAGKAASTIESAARMAFAGAVPQMTRMASDAGTNAVVNRLGFANAADGLQAMDAEGKIVDRNTTGFALWIAPLWQNQRGWGMEAGNMDYGFNGNLGGVSLGADYTFENALRAGITFNIGGGYAETSGGDLNNTRNNMNFWGLGAYAGWNYENFGLMADISYTSTWNQLKQDMDSRMGMGDLEADVQATAISAGLRAEYLLQTSVMDIIPHIGVRYMSLNTWGYDVDTHGGTVLEGDGFHQDIWTFPVGVTFSKDFALDNGFTFKPSVDFSVIPAAGDIKAKHDVRFTGAPVGAELETQMMDYLTWQGGVGLELGNDTMSFGVNYTLQAGQHSTGHGLFGSFRYEF